MKYGCNKIRRNAQAGHRFSRSLRIAIAASLPFWASCTAFKPATPDESEAPKPDKAPRLVGRIATIPPGKQFVLIQSYGTWNIEPGTILTTRGPDSRTANLRVTGESLGQFAAADLQSGALELGDAVYSRHKPKPPKPPKPPADPESTAQPVEDQINTNSENVQKNN